ncbi:MULTISPECIES: hypothetical protein [Nesterenkonia]|uniref:hypothetical protein n=1 Tax=Nesterenkonia TaxID=57494 RepID=UPI0011B4B973|nr:MULTISPECIES: hypothetical protein [Nesterenkonia]
MHLAALHASAAANAQPDSPTWAPILFAAGAFAFMVVVLLTMWKKIRTNEQWHQAEEDTEGNDHGTGHDRED